MPKKPVRENSPRDLRTDDAEQLTLELARRLKRARAAKTAKAAAEALPNPERSSDAVDALMKRYDRSRPRTTKANADEPGADEVGAETPDDGEPRSS